MDNPYYFPLDEDVPLPGPLHDPTQDPYWADHQDKGSMITSTPLPGHESPIVDGSRLPDGAPVLPAWPSCEPVTLVSPSMAEFLLTSPPMFLLPSSAECSEDGLCLGDSWLSSDEVFVGLLSGNRVAAFRTRSLEVMEWTVRLKRLSEVQPPQPPSLSRRLPHIQSLLDWCTDHPKAWSHTSSGGTVTFIPPQGSDILLPITRPTPDSKTRFTLPWKFSHPDGPTAEAFNFLQAPPLADSAHRIPELAQQFTSPVPPPLRTKDDKARAKALSAVSGLLMVHHGVQTLETAIPSAPPEMAALLEGTRSILGAAIQTWDPLTKFLLEEAALARRSSRKAAASSVLDLDIRSRLVDAPVGGSSLFHKDSISATVAAVDRPAPRLIRTAMSGTRPFHIAPSGASLRSGPASFRRPAPRSSRSGPSGFPNRPSSYPPSVPRRVHSGFPRQSVRPYPSADRGRASFRRPASRSRPYPTHRPLPASSRPGRGRGGGGTTQLRRV